MPRRKAARERGRCVSVCYKVPEAPVLCVCLRLCLYLCLSLCLCLCLSVCLSVSLSLCLSLSLSLSLSLYLSLSISISLSLYLSPVYQYFTDKCLHPPCLGDPVQQILATKCLYHTCSYEPVQILIQPANSTAHCCFLLLARQLRCPLLPSTKSSDNRSELPL